jgi:hypothetical protein
MIRDTLLETFDWAVDRTAPEGFNARLELEDYPMEEWEELFTVVDEEEFEDGIVFEVLDEREERNIPCVSYIDYDEEKRDILVHISYSEGWKRDEARYHLLFCFSPLWVNKKEEDVDLGRMIPSKKLLEATDDLMTLYGLEHLEDI